MGGKKKGRALTFDLKGIVEFEIVVGLAFAGGGGLHVAMVDVFMPDTTLL